jgi:hypothetical protein
VATRASFTVNGLPTPASDVLYEDESTHGSLDMENPVTNGLTQGPPLRWPFLGPGLPDHNVDRLLQLVKELDVELGLERSFKISEKLLLENRFLLGTSKHTIKQKPHEKLLGICERMDMPRDFLGVFSENLAKANYVHFGFEENVGTCLYKVYLEFYEDIEERVKRQPAESGPFVLHLGFKWNVSDNTKHALTQYLWYPLLSVRDMLTRMADRLDPRGYQKPLEVAKGIVTAASVRMAHQAILYLEVTEENNPRRSFDINMYRAGVKLRELYPFLLNMFRHYGIPPEEFRALYTRDKAETLGHLSGGIDRDGKDFLTVYYGVKGYSLQDRELKDSPLKRETLPLTGADRVTPLPLPPSQAERDDEKAHLIFQLVEDLKVHYGLEKSFKISNRTMLKNRFLLGIKRKTIKEESDKKILNICERIEMPGDFLEVFKENLAAANIVLFGFEGNGKTSILKAYLEFGGRVREAFLENPDSPRPFPIHLGFKWDAADKTKRTLARYTCYPAISVERILERILLICEGDKQNACFDIAKGVLYLALTRIGPEKFLYVEVNEENNPRRSFDLNLYRAGLEVGELYPLLLRACRQYSIAPRVFHAGYDEAKEKLFGHLSGGVDREGNDFLTVYYNLVTLEQ